MYYVGYFGGGRVNPQNPLSAYAHDQTDTIFESSLQHFFLLLNEERLSNIVDLFTQLYN